MLAVRPDEGENCSLAGVCLETNSCLVLRERPRRVDWVNNVASFVVADFDTRGRCKE